MDRDKQTSETASLSPLRSARTARPHLGLQLGGHEGGRRLCRSLHFRCPPQRTGGTDHVCGRGRAPPPAGTVRPLGVDGTFRPVSDQRIRSFCPGPVRRECGQDLRPHLHHALLAAVDRVACTERTDPRDPMGGGGTGARRPGARARALEPEGTRGRPSRRGGGPVLGDRLSALQDHPQALRGGHRALHRLAGPARLDPSDSCRRVHRHRRACLEREPSWRLSSTTCSSRE